MGLKEFIKEESKLSYMADLEKKLKKDNDRIPMKGYFRPYLKVDKPEIVIIGQDPYSTGIVEFGKYKDYYNGLAFSTSALKAPYSLKIMQRSFLITDKSLGYKDLRISNDLSYLEDRGVILANTYLSVSRGEPLSHSFKEWYTFTKRIVSYIDNEYAPTFILLGYYAQTLNNFIKKGMVINDAHPASLRFNKNRSYLTCFYKYSNLSFNNFKWTK